MIFEISTASYNPKNDCPCEGAFQTDGEWFIEVNTLEELTSLADKVENNLVVGRSFSLLPEDKDRWHIIIYDGYLE